MGVRCQGGTVWAHGLQNSLGAIEDDQKTAVHAAAELGALVKAHRFAPSERSLTLEPTQMLGTSSAAC